MDTKEARSKRKSLILFVFEIKEFVDCMLNVVIRKNLRVNFVLLRGLKSSWIKI